MDWWEQNGYQGSAGDYTAGRSDDVMAASADPAFSARWGNPTEYLGGTGVMPTQAPAWRPTAPVASNTGSRTAYSDSALQAILNRYPPTNSGMRQAMAEIDRTFGSGTVKLLDHPERLDKLVLPDGRTIDVIVGAGGANPSWGWMVEGAGGHGGGTLGGLAGGRLMGNPMAGRNIKDDPSYQFRLDEGLKALQRSAAAKGTLLTGGTMKALERFAQDYASTEYSNAYARAASEQGNDFDRLFRVSNMGLQATTGAANSSGTYGSQAGANSSGYAANAGNTLTGAGNAQANATATRAANNAAYVNNLGRLVRQGTDDGDLFKFTPAWRRPATAPAP